MQTGLQTIKDQSLVKSENQIVKEALLAPKIKDSNPDDIDDAISASIEKAIFYLGLKTPIQDRSMIKHSVFNDVTKHFPLMTKDEIIFAIDAGSHGQYGPVVGISPKDIYNWIVAFSKSDIRKTKLIEIEKEQEENPQPSDEQQAQMRWDNLINAWLFYKKNRYVNDYGNAVFNTLEINGKLSYTSDQMEDFRRMAKLNLEKKYNPLNHVGDFVKVSEVKAILTQIRNEDKNARVESETKLIALTHFFGELLDFGTEVQDLFTEME